MYICEVYIMFICSYTMAYMSCIYEIYTHICDVARSLLNCCVGGIEADSTGASNPLTPNAHVPASPHIAAAAEAGGHSGAGGGGAAASARCRQPDLVREELQGSCIGWCPQGIVLWHCRHRPIFFVTCSETMLAPKPSPSELRLWSRM